MSGTVSHNNKVSSQTTESNKRSGDRTKSNGTPYSRGSLDSSDDSIIIDKNFVNSVYERDTDI